MSDLVVAAGGTAPPSRRPWRGVNRLFRRHRPLAVTRADRTGRRVAAGHLRRLARPPRHQRLLPSRRVHRRADQRVDDRQRQAGVHDTFVPRRRRAQRGHRRVGHRAVPGDRPAGGVLHRQGRPAVGPARARRRHADAVVGRLPRQGLRLEGDAAPGVASSASTPAAACSTPCSAGRRGSATSPSSSPSPTCGCRTW